MILTLERMEQDDRGTYGLLYGLQSDLVTLERPWVRNIPNISCIPVGEYKCRVVVSQKYGKTYMVTGVQGRSAILFHQGNYVRDSRGCILLGISGAYDDLKQEMMIHKSRASFRYFIGQLTNIPRFNLIIK